MTLKDSQGSFRYFPLPALDSATCPGSIGSFYWKMIQAYLGDTVVSVPDHYNKVSIAIKKVIIFFVGGGFCLQFVKIATSQKHNKAQHSDTRQGCI